MPRRSPIIFWLLLAATLSVDAVVFSWVATSTFPPPHYAMVAFEALVIGQLSLVCTWSAVRSTKVLLLPALVAVLVATLLTAMFANGPVSFAETFKSYLAPRGLHAALLLVALWLLQRTMFWLRRTGVSRQLRFSVAHLLIAMTVVAVLATSARQSPFTGEGKLMYLVFTCCNVVLAVVSVVLWISSAHWLLRLAGVLGCAALFDVAIVVIFAVTENLPFRAAEFATTFGVFFVLQSMLLSMWLGLGPILPVATTTAVDT